MNEQASSGAGADCAPQGFRRNGDAELATAISELRVIIGDDSVLTGSEAQGRYGACTTPYTRRIPAAVLVSSAEEIGKALDIARRCKVPVYPVGTGRNWGYGTANPVRDDCIVLDLSRMNRILDLDAELGLVTLEPGVTQRQLHHYLEERNLNFLVPVHGGGPNCSLVGNALERGYGITPYADHFGAVMALEAILPSGGKYRSSIAELGGSLVDKTFKWGTGPYLDGLFSQSGYGIVTQMTIALAPRPEATMAFFFSLADDRDLEEAVVRVRAALREVAGVVGSINLMNRPRVLSMMVPYPHDKVASGATIPEQLLAELGRRHQVMMWTGAGALYGAKAVVNGAKRVVARCLRPLVKRLVFVSSDHLRLARRVVDAIPGVGSSRVGNIVSTLEKTLQLLEGMPSEIALPLAYWKAPQNLPKAGDMDPARDGCGLIWYSPLIPMKPELIRSYVAMVEQICRKHGIDPLITLTSLSDRCFDSTVPILFRRSDPDETARARACHDELLATGISLGFIPYRASIETMKTLVRPDTAFWDLARQIKRSLDGNDLVSPGRYS